MPDETPVKQVPVLAISIEGKFNQSRSVVFQTHLPLDSDQKEIYSQFSQLCEIMDRREEFYLLKGLNVTLQRDEAQLEADRIKVGNLEQAYFNEHVAGGRKGEFKLTGQQKVNVENQRSGLQALVDRIKKVKSEIAELEEMQKAYK